jgi:NhaA family Na+:H+ antiporter
MLATVAALVWANSPLAGIYEALWGTRITVGTEAVGLSKPLILWINDFLMAIFFLVVGLEIKRELLVGELSSARKAAAPVIAAVGGMVVPAVIYLAFAHEGEASRGWGVPMATDIAFALGCMRLLGERIPSALVVFLTALAIIDDLGAILVIALFYSGDLSVAALVAAALVTGVLVAMNVAGVHRPVWYLLVGIPLWVAILESGIHATIAGVLLGFCVPSRPPATEDDVFTEARHLLDAAEREDSDDREAAFEALRAQLDARESTLSKLEHALHPWVAYAIVPLFALANAGVSLAGISPAALGTPVSLGILLGLFIGKQVGVFGATWLAVRAGVAALPTDTGWTGLYGASIVAGIGFTMSLFIAGLAFESGSALHTEAKIAILLASAVSAAVGLFVLGRTGKRA